MKINQVIELEEGKKVQFTGELEGKELDFIIQTGLTFLIYSGMFSRGDTTEKPEGELH